ncbi:MAG: InlB B-repeat-containing protein, partial [Clostridia bacterium]|nr:InlB B-repeat-containing protein [Clostridia bacterium]
MRKVKKALSVLLVITCIFSFNIVSMAYPELKSVLSGLFSAEASAIDELIMQYAPEGTQDFALKAVVSATSSYSSADGKWHLDRINDGSFTFNGSKAGFSTDTNETTNQNESLTKPLTLTFDLEGYYDISRVALFTHGAFPDEFEIRTSMDGKEDTYKTIKNETGRAGFSDVALPVDFTATRARFVQIHVTKRGNLDGNDIYLVQFGEIAIYGKTVAATNTDLNIYSYAPEHCINLAPESEVTVNDSYNADPWNENKINDGVTARSGGFTSLGQNIDDLQIDFNIGNISHIKKVVLFPNGEAPKTIEILKSFDGVNYEKIKTVSIPEEVYQHNENTAEVNKVDKYFTFDLPNDTFASHIRVLVTERFESDSMVQFAELAIYGVKNVFNTKINKSDVNILVGDTLQFEWTPNRSNDLFYTFFDYDFDIEWKPANTSVVAVNSSGLATGKAVGKTTITATNDTIDYSVTIDVNVCSELPYKRDNFTISAFSPPKGKLFTDEQYERIKEAGIDLLINSYNFSTTEENLALLEMAGNHGLNSIVSDNRFWTEKENLSQELVDEVYADYKGISNLEGVYLFDEPWNGNEYVDSATKLADVMPGSFVSLNYFPGYIYNSYEQYEYTFNDLAALVNGKVDLMFDIYPFHYNNTTNYNQMFNSLEAIRRSGLKYNLNTAACMQTHGYGPANGNLTHRNPTETDMRYQGMTYIAYGIKHLSYWKYSSTEPGAGGAEKHEPGAITVNGEITAQYKNMQAVNPVLRNVGNALYNCDAKEVYITGTDHYGLETIPENFFVQIEGGNNSKSLVVSYLKDKTSGRNYLMVVNSDLGQAVKVGLNFASEIKNIRLFDNDNYNDDNWSDVSLNGTYNCTIAAGDAALIELPADYRYAEQAEETKGGNALYHKTVYGDSSIGTPGTRDNKLPGWYLSCLTDGFIEQNSAQGLNGWSSELKDAPYETTVTIDLGATKTLSSLTLHAADSKTGHYNYFPKSYTLQYSTNGEDWKNLAVVNNSQPEDYVPHEFSPTAMRYVRLWVRDMHSVNGKYAASLAEIETSESKTTENGKVAFYVPEIIYLRPVSSSWDESTSAAFQFYIENTMSDSNFYADPSPSSAANTQGTIKFAAEEGFSDVSLSYQFEDSSGSVLSGSVSKTDNGTVNVAGGTYQKYTITGGTSPSLASNVSGCYLKWTLKYKSSEDNLMRSVVAYSYVYKPYVVPIAGLNRVKNTGGSSHYGATIAWLSGVHSITSGGDYAARYATNDKESGFLPFASTQNIVGNSSTTSLAKLGYADCVKNGSLMYTVYSNQYETNGYFRTSFGDPGASTWFSTSVNTAAASTNNTTFDIKTATYIDSEDGKWNDDTVRFANNIVKAKGNILIDTSRYGNLNQIPNLSVGLMSADVNNGDYVAWYVADFTGKTASKGHEWWLATKDNDNANDGRRTIWENHGTYMAMYGSENSSGQFTDDTTQSGQGEKEDIKYSGTWNATISASNTAYQFKTVFVSEDGRDSDSCVSAQVFTMNATHINRSTLRNAVYATHKEFSRFGVKENFGSYYYDTDSTAWINFVNAYKKACKELTKLDGAPSSDTVKKLDDAVAALKAGQGRRFYFDVNYDGINPNLYVYKEIETTAGGLKTEFNSADETITINGMQTSDAHFFGTPFTPTSGDYQFTVRKTKGMVTNRDGCLVFEAYSDVPHGQLTSYTGYGGTPSDRRKIDYRAALSSSAEEVVSETVIFGASAEKKHNLAYGTDLLHFWSWRNSLNADYTDFTFNLKIEEGSKQTAYSPAGRVGRADGKYGTLPTPTRPGHTFLGWYTNPSCTGDPVTADSQATCGMLYAKWRANEVIFGNAFDFDSYLWAGKEGNGSNEKETVIKVNYNSNYVILKSGDDKGYTSHYEGHQPGAMTLIPGRTYEFSCTAENLSAMSVIAQLYLFTFDSFVNNELQGGTGDVGVEHQYVSTTVEANGTVTLKGTLKIPSGRQYASIRVGSVTEGAEIKFSDICIRDVSKLVSPYDIDESLTKADPMYKVAAAGGTVKDFPTIKRDGYEFRGWYKEDDPDKNVIEEATPTGDNIQLFPKWSSAFNYTIKFDSNGGVGTMADMSMTYDTPTNLTENAFERAGCTFKGWNTKSDGSGKGYADGEKVNLVPKENGEVITLYAQWSFSAEIMFGNEFDFDAFFSQFNNPALSVDFDKNSFTMTAPEGDEDYSAQDFAGTLRFIPNHKYRVVYTYTADSGASVGQWHMFFYTDETMGTTLADYHRWEDSGSKDMLLEGQTTVYTSEFVAPSGFAKIRFDIDRSAAVVTSKAKATFSKIYIYDITADASISVPDPIFKTDNPGTVINSNDFPKPTRDNYTFLGWSTQRDDETGLGTGSAVDSVTVPEKGTKTLYSLWEINKYTIRFDPNGATAGAMEDLVVPYGEKVNLSPNRFKNTGFTFCGWNTEADGSGDTYADGEEVYNLTSENGKVITLYAQWSAYEVLFGNLFDFDNYLWAGKEGNGSDEKETVIKVNYSSNSVLLKSGDDKGYTSHYEGHQPGAMTLVPARTYEFSCTAENLSAMSVIAQLYLFTFDSFVNNELQDGIGNEGVDFNYVSTTVAANGTVTLKGTLKIPSGRPYASIRVGSGTEGAEIKFSDICVRDITNFADTPKTDDVIKANPISKSADANGKVTGFPKLTRTGYTFEGWGADIDVNGNGKNPVNEWVFKNTDNGNKILYPIWSPNVVIVRMHLGTSTVDQNFYFGKAQALTPVPETPGYKVDFYDGEDLTKTELFDIDFVHWSKDENAATKLYNNAESIANPGGADLYKTSKETFNLYAKWANMNGDSIEVPFATKDDHVFVGWSLTKNSKTADYKAEQEIIPEGDMSLYAVWKSVPEVDKIISAYQNAYSGKQEVVSGIEIGADGVAKAKKIVEVLGVYDTKDFDNAKSEYDAAKNAYESNKNAATNNALLDAIGNVETSAAKVPSSNGSEMKYLDKFEIKYAEGVEGAVPAGKYSVADMNLNHYTKEELDKVSTEWGTARTYT